MSAGVSSALSVPGLTLVRSKLVVPSPAGLLHRPHVCQSIERGLECRLTVISAPAGYGKTSALVDFAHHSPVPVCWYTADERDRDLGVFLEYLVGAIGERFPGFGERTRAALDAMADDSLHNSTGIVGEFVNEMMEVDTSFVLVMDNFEVLDGAFGIRRFVRRLLEIIPFNCHLMVGSRMLPDVPITRLVAKRQLVGLTVEDLRFTPREVRGLLGMSQIEVTEVQAEAIAAKSEGWITGVLLLADLLRDEAKSALLDAEGATADTYSFLASEVLSRQPPRIRRFLCTSAALREMSPHLFREILQVKESRALLAEVERRNLFVTRFGKGSAATYRYHNLFRSFLHQRLCQRDPVQCAELHLRAARWFERDGDVEEAVYHYLAAGYDSDATALMERVATEWFARGRVETLLRWTQELSEEARAQAARLSLYQSKVHTDRYEYERARQALAHAEAGFMRRGDTANLAEVHMQRATLGLFEGRYDDAMVEAQTALRILGQEEGLESARAQRLIGKAYLGLGRLSEGCARLQEVLVLFRRFGGHYDVVNLLRDLVPAFTAQGRFDEAAACMNEALSIARRLGAPVQIAGVLNNLGYIHYVRGEYRRALTLFEEGLAAARRGGALRLEAYISGGMADIYRDVGIYERAARLYDASLEMSWESEPSLAVYVLTARACMRRWQQDNVQALRLLEQARQVAEERGLSYERQGLVPVEEGITLAESGEIEAGLRLLSDAESFLEQHQAKQELARARFLLAEAHLLAGDRSEALVALRRSMNLVDEIGTLQFAVVEGRHVEELVDLGVAENVASCHLIPKRVQQLVAFGEEMARDDVPEETAEEGPGRLEIYALGEGRVVCDGRPVSTSEWRGAMTKELFFYILLHGPLERDAIGLVFWPDLSAKKMTDSFHTTLYRMRRAVGAEAVVVEDGRYRLGDVDYWFDVQEFEESVQRARLLPYHDWQAENLWRRAVSLYEGDFLPEVERLWCVPKREALREMYIEALVGMGRCYEIRKECEEAIVWYKRALRVDELREDIHRCIMECYDRVGRRAKALAQYRRCREILKRELGLEPSTETRTVCERIKGTGVD